MPTGGWSIEQNQPYLLSTMQSFGWDRARWTINGCDVAPTIPIDL